MSEIKIGVRQCKICGVEIPRSQKLQTCNAHRFSVVKSSLPANCPKCSKKLDPDERHAGQCLDCWADELPSCGG